MKCDKCQNKADCYDGNHELTRSGCAENNWCCFSPITNADRIRAMSDEELAFQLYLLRIDALRLEGFEGEIETKEEILDWLREEAGE